MITAFALLALTPAARAATLTYAVGGAADGRVVVGFDNDASGDTTTDTVSDPTAFSRNDTLYGPLPAPGTLPSFDAQAHSAAELGTNLSSPTGAPPRTVFAPFNPTFFRAAGQTLAATGSYAAHAFSRSGTAASTGPTAWTVQIDPEAGESVGDPVTVTISAEVAGTLGVSGAATADATWSVSSTAAGGGVIGGAASQATAGSSAFGESDTLVFSTTIGSSFDLLVDFDLEATGAGAGATSEASLSQALVTVDVAAALAPPPLALLCSAVPEGNPVNHGWFDARGAIALDDPTGVGPGLRARVLSDEATAADGGADLDVDDALDSEDALALRAERSGEGDGRVYLLLVEADAGAGAQVRAACVGGVVPHDRSRAHREAVLAEAEAALQDLEAALDAAGDIDAVDAAALGLHDVSAGE